ncbi:ATP-dependent DNA helicase [Cereibacter sphaeroides]|nr:ATP-dependent RecD-like DNA helicase [Cereibacter sphaeroides]
MNTHSMPLSPEQVAAIDKAGAWLGNPRKNRKQVFKLFGYAGTGKTTIARRLAEGVDGDVVYAAFTGKAALMMQKNGCEGASTIHRLIYRPEQQPDGATRFALNAESLAAEAALIIIDECSMVNAQIAKDLLSFGKPVLVLGDPAQLPPPKDEGWFVRGKPDVMLTEIHRQALDNPILRLATAARNGEPLRAGDYGTSHVMRICELEMADCLAADQILAGSNDRVQLLNRQIREALGRPDFLPCPEDRLVCLRNDYGKAIVNGGMFEVRSAQPARFRSGLLSMKVANLDFPDWPELMVRVPEECFTKRIGTQVSHAPRDLQLFDYGYALTCHKAQGSQWENVLVHDESEAFKQDRHRWLYTAITRASDRVTIAI